MVLTEKQVREKLKTYAPIVQKYDSPISVATRLAQLIVESQMFTSELALKSNNGFGIKASAPWTGDSVPHVSGEVGGARESEFRKYPSHEASIKDHAEFFTSTPFRETDKVYGLAIKATNYKDEAKYLAPKFTGDKYSYAGDPNYATKLIDKVERYNLTQYDTQKGTDTMSFPRPKMIDRRKRALGYPSHGAYARRSKSSIKNIVRHYTAVNRKGGEENTIKAHENYWRNHHKWEIGGYGIYIDFEGNIYWNYDFDIVTYGAGRLNPQLFHVCLEGSSFANHTPKQLKALDDVMLWLLSDPLKHLNGNDIRGHKEIPYNDTACPGMTKAQLNDYRASITAKLKSGSKPVDPNNPQGMATTPFKEYKEPRLPFDELKKGDTVTLDTNWQWADLSKRQLLASPKYKDLLGTKDKIAEVIKLDKPGNHSKVAYRLEKYNSIILEEYLEESKRRWELKPVEVEAPKEVKQKYEELQEGEYIDNDGVVWVWKKK
ncbi:glucosaminidase domain-containing protein [Ruoffia sp. FAM 24228]|uniref:glucosaminidase domain-containing protein n=1 Tax=Ruoffia sp. FAM 24228 TaxID=3259517 RepID=UPI003884EAD5